MLRIAALAAWIDIVPSVVCVETKTKKKRSIVEMCLCCFIYH